MLLRNGLYLVLIFLGNIFKDLNIPTVLSMAPGHFGLTLHRVGYTLIQSRKILLISGELEGGASGAMAPQALSIGAPK